MARYFPEAPPSPSDIKDRILYEWVFRELDRISAALFLGGRLNLEKQFALPPKPQDGDIVYADGTSWNPGAGVGLYARINNAWVKLS